MDLCYLQTNDTLDKLYSHSVYIEVGTFLVLKKGAGPHLKHVQSMYQITSLGVVMDSNLTFNAHITALCKACHFHLRSLRHIRCSLTDDMAILIAVALVQSRLDYCNSLFFNISGFNINKLQHVQNLVARLALNDWRSPIQRIFVKLHWLPIQAIKFQVLNSSKKNSSIKFKICTLTYKLRYENQPANLRSLITSYVPPRLLRSSDQCQLTPGP